MNAPRDVDEVRAVVDLIHEASADPEVAHGLEDGLYQDVLRAIADGTAVDPQEMAREALDAQSIPFDRWMA